MRETLEIKEKQASQPFGNVKLDINNFSPMQSSDIMDIDSEQLEQMANMHQMNLLQKQKTIELQEGLPTNTNFRSLVP